MKIYPHDRLEDIETTSITKLDIKCPYCKCKRPYDFSNVTREGDMILICLVCNEDFLVHISYQ